MKTVLAGFKARDATPHENRGPKDPRRYLYCHRNLRGKKGVLPRCRLLHHILNESANSLLDIFYPYGWDKLPQPRSQLESIDRQIMVLDWWVKERVDPESPAFSFYAYSSRPCWRRLCAAELAGDGKLITQLTYNHPASAAKLRALWGNLKKKATEYDAMARVVQESQCWIDLSGLVDPVEVKGAAAALRNELRIIGELVEEEQKPKAAAKMAAESTRVCPRPMIPKRYGLAHESYEWACKKQPSLLQKDRYSDALYKYVKENWPGYGDDGVKCPPKGTWARYVREYERLTTGPKNTSLQDRGGRSIVHQDEV